MRGSIGDNGRHLKSSGDSRGKCRGWEDMARILRSLHVCLEDRGDSTTNVLGYNNPDTKGGRGVPENRADGTNMEGAGEGDGSQIGENRAA